MASSKQKNDGLVTRAPTPIAPLEVGGDASERSRYLTAMMNAAEVTCRRCDVLAELLGERHAFGNFADEFEALTEERAAELERREAEASE